MAHPAWDDTELDAGVMVRGALWLLQVVGVGNVFTKTDIREAFPATAQADRRIRDLRDFQWVLHSRAEDASLLPEQTRFVRPGVDVWDSRARRAGSPAKGISAKVRDQVMARDGYLCTTCGIAGGEEYPDDPAQSAVLSVTKRSLVLPSGSTSDTWATTCNRCKAGRGAGPVSITEAIGAADSLEGSALEALLEWIGQGRRPLSPTERAWALYRELPPEGRAEVRARLGV